MPRRAAVREGRDQGYGEKRGTTEDTERQAGDQNLAFPVQGGLRHAQSNHQMRRKAKMLSPTVISYTIYECWEGFPDG